MGSRVCVGTVEGKTLVGNHIAGEDDFIMLRVGEEDISECSEGIAPGIYCIEEKEMTNFEVLELRKEV